MILSMPFFSFKFIFSVLILLNIEIFSRGAEEPGKNHYDVFDIDSVMQKPNCSAHKKVEVPSFDEILRKNEARVRWLNRRILNSYTTMDDSGGKSPQPGNHLDDAEQYTTEVGLGTPTGNYKLLIDTGSPYTWLRCKPCLQGCKSESPLFDPSKSSTHRNDSDPYPPEIRYGDGSHASLLWGFDTLKIDSYVINGFRFGCSQNNLAMDNFANAAGILGLGPGDNSLLSRFPSTYGKIFGYCFPQQGNRNGYLVFGQKAREISSSSTLKFTKLLPRKDHYFVQLDGISVNGTRLDISSDVFTSGGTIIDSGTVVTHLPKQAYSALTSAFKQYISADYKPAPQQGKLDTCYIVKEPFEFPPITFHFDGATDVDLDESGIGLYDKGKNTWCLAFTANQNDQTIIGNTQQRETQVIYDLGGGKIGFGRKGCGPN